MFLVFSTGCAMSQRVVQAGHYEHSLYARSYGMTEEGHMVIHAELRTSRAETLLTRGKPRRPNSKRYIIADPHIVRESVGAAREVEADLQERVRQGRTATVLRREGEPLKLRVSVTGPDEDGWRMIPYDHKRRGADRGMLPDEFREVDYDTYSLWGPGRKYGLWREETEEAELLAIDHLLLPGHLREQVMWWRYPALAFLPVTVVADFVTFPVQAVIVVWQINQDWK